MGRDFAVTPAQQLWQHYIVRPREGKVPYEEAFHKALAKHYRGRILYQQHFRAMRYNYFADFYLADDNVIFEVDDPSHLIPSRAAKDETRTLHLTEVCGVKGIYRTTNKAVREDPEAAAISLLKEANLWNP